MYALFGSTQALDKMVKEQKYKLQHALCRGTALAFERKQQIMPWDSDADIFLIFEKNLSFEELEKFKQDLKQTVDEMYNISSELGWSLPKGQMCVDRGDYTKAYDRDLAHNETRRTLNVYFFKPAADENTKLHDWTYSF